MMFVIDLCMFICSLNYYYFSGYTINAVTVMTTSAQQRNTFSSKATTALLHFSWSPWSTSIRARLCSRTSPAQAALALRRFSTLQGIAFSSSSNGRRCPRAEERGRRQHVCVYAQLPVWWVPVIFISNDVARWRLSGQIFPGARARARVVAV